MCWRRAWRSCVGSENARRPPPPASSSHCFDSLGPSATLTLGRILPGWQAPVPGALGKLTAWVHMHPTHEPQCSNSAPHKQSRSTWFSLEGAASTGLSFLWAAFPRQPPPSLEPPGHEAASGDLGCREEVQWRRRESSSTSVPCGSGPGWGVKPCLRLSQGNVISLE